MAPLLNEEESALDPYAVLGVETTASEKEIKQAFRKMSLKCHPDRVSDLVFDSVADVSSTREKRLVSAIACIYYHESDPIAIQFRQLSVSVEILSDPAKRAFLSTQLEAKRANKERYEKMHKKRQGAVDVSHFCVSSSN